MRRIILRIRQADRFVPICDIGQVTKDSVILESPPPYRNEIKIDVEGLIGILGMAGSSNDQVRLGFRNQPEIIRAMTSVKGPLTAVTKATQFRKEKNQNEDLVTYNSDRQELRLAIAYLDNEVKTSTATAKNLSEKLAKALLAIPAKKYSADFFKYSDRGLVGESSSGRKDELLKFSTNITINLSLPPVVYGIFSTLANEPRPLETVGFMAALNMVKASIELKLALDLLKGRPVDEKVIWSARVIAEQPLRVIYPVSLVHEFLLPTANILAHNIKSSAPLLKSSGD